MKGKILDFDNRTNIGLISADDGQRYGFTGTDVKSSVAVSKGMEADFIIEGTDAKEIYLSESLSNIFAMDVPYYEEQEHGFKELFRAKGCYTRWQYWKVTLVTIGIWVVYAVMIGVMMSAGNGKISNTNTAILSALFVFILLPLFYINIVTSIKRFHDINRSGWFYLFSLIPYIGGLILLVMNGFMPTVKEGNIYCQRKKKDN